MPQMNPSGAEQTAAKKENHHCKQPQAGPR